MKHEVLVYQFDARLARERKPLPLLEKLSCEAPVLERRDGGKTTVGDVDAVERAAVAITAARHPGRKVRCVNHLVKGGVSVVLD